MAGFAYLLLPVTGLIAYLAGGNARSRFHGLQAVTIGLLWPLLLYAASFIATGLTQVVGGAGVLVWLLFLIGALIGRDPKIPVLWSPLRRLAVASAEQGSSTGAR